MAETAVDDALWDDFHGLVTMTAPELREWLTTTAGGQDVEALPDHAGPERSRALLEVLDRPREELSDDDVVVMRSVVEEIRGLLEGGAADPDRDAKLRSLGHDPSR
jgi:hypothetical protein